MSARSSQISPQRLLIVMPTWLGDCVMAGPTLRALRRLFEQAHISALIKANMRPVLEGCPWIDRILTIRPRRKGRSDQRRRGPLRLARRLAAGRFDTVVLLPNSFRTAMMVSLAGIPRRIGYDREGRGFMLTDRLLPPRDQHGFTPIPAIDYYLGIARYLGAEHPDPAMALAVSEHEQCEADQLLARAGIVAGGPPLVLLNVGASKPEKCWPPQRFAQLADHLAQKHRAVVALTGSPREMQILSSVQRQASSPPINLASFGLTLSSLKAVIRGASLLVTNDTGPRHLAAAAGTPVVSLFGPTDPAWTRIDFALERQIVAADQTMKGIRFEQVAAAADELLRGAAVKD
ncbi:MAG: lipopolysaccharide heptosyltransferase II [Phycisphaeraceae bacterium]|nr:lipopolysaccharide heptosyltransferase II [Phycisphaeraceae bacterium]